MIEIKQLDIVDLISRFVSLSNFGKNLKGLCPFHEEKTPSFTVNPEKNSFYCFGCHEKGDAADFIQKIYKCSFKEALKHLSIKEGYTSCEEMERIKRERQAKKDFETWLIKADTVLSGAIYNIDYITHYYINTVDSMVFWGFLYHRQAKYEYWRTIISKGSDEEKKKFQNDHWYLSDIFDYGFLPGIIERERAKARKSLYG